MMTLKEFIEANGITMSTKHVGTRTDASGWHHDVWRCVLRMEGDRMQVTFNMGMAHKGNPPGLDDVLDSLGSDAALIENSQWNINQFVAEIGDAPDIGRIFNATARQTERLQRFLTSEQYDTLLWHMERL